MVFLLAILFFHISEQNCFCLEIHYTIAINCIKKVVCQNKNKTMEQLTFKFLQPFPQIL